ncbi:MAG TPA: hypothetical protein DHW34_02840 [Actinobacteria bacterium]|nr:hypothetical protein [Actinomycetota bacterium]
MLIGLLRPTRGSIRVAGIDVVARPRRVREAIGYMGQKVSLYQGLTLRENVQFYAGLHGLEGSALGRRWAALRERFSLAQAEGSRAEDLPAGLRQRAGLALAMLHEPNVLFLDEPTAGLDPAARVRTWDLIAELSGAGADVIVTTHYLAEAEALADDIVLIHHGRVVAQGAPEILRANHSTPGVRIVSAAVFSDDQLRERLIRDLSHILGIPVGCIVGSHDVVITGGDLVVLRRAIVQWFATSAVALEGLADAEADLEEVFFALTTSDTP